MNNDSMFKKALWAIAITVAATLFWGRLAILIIDISSDSGTVINATVNDDRWLLIQSAENPSLMASSCEFFAFKTGKTFLPSEPIDVPFGWPCENYFFLSDKLTQGEWEIMAGAVVNMQFSFESPAQIQYGALSQDVERDMFLMSAIMLLLWIACIALNFL